MKKLLFAGIVALVILLVFPMMVSAVNTVSVSGNVLGYISVNVYNTSPNFGTLSIGTDIIQTPSTVTVNTSYTSWHVDLTSTGGTIPGYMQIGGGTNLTIPFNMSKTIAVPNWVHTTTTWNNFMSGSAAGNYPQDVYVQQIVSPIDTEGAYSITATFTGGGT